MTDAEAVHTIEARVHGRYVVRAPNVAPPWPVLVGFHGYAEDAATHLEALRRIPAASEWLLVSVQALHPFYTRQERIVASWMTSQDRELAILDNIHYVGRVLDDLRREYNVRRPLVFAGFSQGGAMAYRAAAHYTADAIIVLAADVPPDVAGRTPVPLPRTLIGRGVKDDWYTEAKQAADVAALRALGVTVDVCEFDGGHEWTDVFYDAAGRVLTRALLGV